MSATASAIATDTRTLTPDALLTRMRTASGAQLSPDGAEIVYVVGAIDADTRKSASHLHLMDRASGATRQLTTAGTTTSQPAWSPDGTRIAFVSNRGDDGNGWSVCVLPRSGGEAETLTRFEHAPVSLAWSPDGNALAVTVPVGASPSDAPRVVTRIDYKQDNRGLINDQRLHVVLVSLGDQGERQLTREPFDHTFPAFSPDGSRIAVKQNRLNGMVSQLLIMELDGDVLTRIGTEEGSVGTFAWSPEGDSIVYDATPVSSPQTDYYLYSVASDRSRQLTEDTAFSSVSGFPTISGPDQPRWVSPNRVRVHAHLAGASGIWEIDTDSGAIDEIVIWDATHGGFNFDDDHRWIVMGRSWLGGAGELVLVDFQSGDTRQLTDLNTHLFEQLPLGHGEKITVDRDGWAIDAWITRPPDFDPSRRYPVVLDVHGGPHGNYGYLFGAGAQLMASAGYIVVQANPRGSGTYGRAFGEAVRGDWGGEDWLDLLAVLDTVLESPWADGDRTAIYGYSYGGYMTAWAIGQTDRFRAAICGAPVFNMASMYGTSDITHTFGPNQWGGEPAEVAQFMHDRSPSTWIHRATTPTLIVHGEQDHRCPIGQGEEMFVGLLKAGCEVEFVRYPGGSHLMLRGAPLDHRIDYFTRLIDWLDRHL